MLELHVLFEPHKKVYGRMEKLSVCRDSPTNSSYFMATFSAFVIPTMKDAAHRLVFVDSVACTFAYSSSTPAHRKTFVNNGVNMCGSVFHGSQTRPVNNVAAP